MGPLGSSGGISEGRHGHSSFCRRQERSAVRPCALGHPLWHKCRSEYSHSCLLMKPCFVWSYRLPGKILRVSGLSGRHPENSAE